MRPALALAALAAAGFFLNSAIAPTPAHAACAEDAAMTKEMAMEAEGDAKEMALKHVAMAMEKAEASMEEDCMAEVVKAKAALDGEMMDKMDDTATN